MCLDKLIHLLPEKDNCKEHNCRVTINIKNVKIFDTENEQGRQLLRKHRQRKFCDCIIYLNDRALLIIEILCGELTEKELTDKEKQVNTWQRILKEELTTCEVIICFIVFLKHSIRENFFERKILSLRNRGIFLRQFKRSKRNPHITLTELLAG